MKRLLLLALLAVPCFALTTVQDTLYTATGAFCSGKVTLSWDTFTSPTDGHTVYEGTYEFPVTAAINGLSVSLEPGQYTASYNITPSGCAPAYEQWIVPSSPGTVNLAGVRSINPPVPYSLVSLAWLAQDGAVNGNGMCWTTLGGWGPGTCGGGGGGSMTWPGAAGLAVYAGSSAWGTSLTAPSGLQGVTFTSYVPSLTALGTAATATLGTSGATVPLLNTANTWSALQTVTSMTGSGGVVDMSGSTHTTPAKVGVTASKPAVCAIGEMYFATDATPGQNWYYCTASNTWTQQTGGGGGSGLSGSCTWSVLEAGSCGAGSLAAAMTWAEIEAL
jgi:hypothetical protein